MKVRYGFVSNSSSSSFVCEICHNAETLYYGGLEEIDFCECENGHIICAEHLINPNYVRDENEDYTSSKICPICQMKVMPNWMFVAYVEKRLKITPKDMLKDAKSKFNNYSELCKYINSK